MKLSTDEAITTKKQGGFALIVALLGMGLLVAIAGAFLSFSQSEILLAGFSSDRAAARRNALNALMLAMATLQQETGRDCIATVSSLAAENGADGWCFAAEQMASGQGKIAPEVSLNPLVSGYFAKGVKVAPYGKVEVFPAWRDSSGGAGLVEKPAVVVPWLGDVPPVPNAQFPLDEGRSIFPRNRYAFFIEDESQKADVGSCEPAELFALPPELRQIHRLLAATRIGVDVSLGTVRAEAQLWREKLSQAADFSWSHLAWRDTAPSAELFPLHPFLFTNASRGVLSNAAEGGLRINLDQKTKSPLTAEKLPCSIEVWEDFYKRSTRDSAIFAKEPLNGLSITSAETPFSLRRFPLLTWLRVRLGVFHAHNDAYNRTRFHVEAHFWNPNPYPLTIPETLDNGKAKTKEEKNLFALFDVEKGPILTIKNLNTSASLQINTSEFPLGKFGVEQTKSDSTINAQLILPSAPPPNQKNQGFAAGEIFYFHMPDPISQPQGLARTLSSTKWYWQSDPKKINTPPASATGGHWLHPEHVVEITAEIPPEGLVFHLREGKGKLNINDFTANYSKPVLTLKNLRFNNFRTQIAGKEFDRPDSTSYTAAEARLGFALRLRTHDAARLRQAFEKIDPRAPVLDFDDSDIASLYEIIPDPVAAKELPPPVSTAISPLWNNKQNKHSTGQADSADFRLFDRPTKTMPLSIGAIRHVPLQDKPSGTLSLRYPQGREIETSWFDRAFFAGAFADEKERPAVDSARRPWSRNPWLEAIPNPARKSTHDSRGILEFIDPNLAEREDVAAHCFTRGVFNINTLSIAAWNALYARTLENWVREPSKSAQTTSRNGAENGLDEGLSEGLYNGFDRGLYNGSRNRGEVAHGSGVSGAKEKNYSNFYTRLPHGVAHPARTAGEIPDLDDDALANANAETWSRAEGAQGFRSLTAAARQRLAVATVAAIEGWRQREGRPFRSLSEFACSGVLREAVEGARLNEFPAPALPGAGRSAGRRPSPLSALNLTCGDILEPLLPALCVRGDTFKIHAVGAVATPVGAPTAVARLEAVVQRFPDYVEGAQGPFTPFSELSAVNRRLGRRYRVVSLRWVTPADEMP